VWFLVQGLGFRVYGLGVMVRVQNVSFRVWGLGSGVEGLSLPHIVRLPCALGRPATRRNTEVYPPIDPRLLRDQLCATKSRKVNRGRVSSLFMKGL
jgi:hypothetical protein